MQRRKASKYRRDTRDANHAEIVSELRGRGYEVHEIERPVDLFVFNRKLKRGGWLEIKTKARNAGVRRGQLEFMSSTSMPVSFATDALQALEFAERMDGWSQEQKDRVAGVLATDEAKVFHPAKVEKMLL